jgi:hypothetical protein
MIAGAAHITGRAVQNQFLNVPKNSNDFQFDSPVCVAIAHAFA